MGIVGLLYPYCRLNTIFGMERSKTEDGKSSRYWRIGKCARICPDLCHFLCVSWRSLPSAWINKKFLARTYPDNGIVEEGQGSSCVFYAAAMLCQSVRSTIMGGRSRFVQDVQGNWPAFFWGFLLSVFWDIQSLALPY